MRPILLVSLVFVLVNWGFHCWSIGCFVVIVQQLYWWHCYFIRRCHPHSVCRYWFARGGWWIECVDGRRHFVEPQLVYNGRQGVLLALHAGASSRIYGLWLSARQVDEAHLRHCRLQAMGLLQR